jgi:tetratricopeptide (TPR) repeat protein
MTKRLINIAIIFALSLCFAAIASAQTSTAAGTILDVNGAPFPDVTVTAKSDTGRTYTAKTDKDGKFTIPNVPDGLYNVTINHPTIPAAGYTQRFQKLASNNIPWDINLKAVMAASGGGAAAAADQAAFKGMKGHFDAATAAYNEADATRKQLATAPADQKAALQATLSKDLDTALTEYQAAEQGVGAKDTQNHALIWANIGRVEDQEGKFDDAAGSYQKAIDLKPSADYYSQMSTSIINSGVAQKDPAVLQQKVTDASAACDKAISTADAPTQQTVAQRCWKNMGIVLSNKGDLKQAIDPLQKATTAAPKDSQSWFLLGSAYTGTIESVTQGDKEVFNIPPGTTDAFQKCIDNDPTGPYAQPCKDALDGVNAMTGGQSTKFGNAPPAKTPAKKK